MHGMKEIIREAESLPVEERALIIDSLLQNLNLTESEIEQQWKEVAKRRLADCETELLSRYPERTFLQESGNALRDEFFIPSRGGRRVQCGHRLLRGL